MNKKRKAALNSELHDIARYYAMPGKFKQSELKTRVRDRMVLYYGESWGVPDNVPAWLFHKDAALIRRLSLKCHFVAMELFKQWQTNALIKKVKKT